MNKKKIKRYRKARKIIEKRKKKTLNISKPILALGSFFWLSKQKLKFLSLLWLGALVGSQASKNQFQASQLEIQRLTKSVGDIPELLSQIKAFQTMEKDFKEQSLSLENEKQNLINANTNKTNQIKDLEKRLRQLDLESEKNSQSITNLKKDENIFKQWFEANKKELETYKKNAYSIQNQLNEKKLEVEKLKYYADKKKDELKISEKKVENLTNEIKLIQVNLEKKTEQFNKQNFEIETRTLQNAKDTQTIEELKDNLKQKNEEIKQNFEDLLKIREEIQNLKDKLQTIQNKRQFSWLIIALEELLRATAKKSQILYKLK